MKIKEVQREYRYREGRLPLLDRSWGLSILVCILTGGFPLHSAAQNLFSADVKRSYEIIKAELLKAARNMPEKKYGFSPTRSDPTFGEIIANIADLQTQFCGLAVGEKHDGTPVIGKTKADLIIALQASFTMCDRVYSRMTDIEGAQGINLFGEEITRLGLLNGNVAHDNKLYGALSVYLRMNGIKLSSETEKTLSWP